MKIDKSTPTPEADRQDAERWQKLSQLISSRYVLRTIPNMLPTISYWFVLENGNTKYINPNMNDLIDSIPEPNASERSE